MKKENRVRNKTLTVQLSEQEHTSLKHLQQQSTSKYMSAYCRNVLLQKPVFIKYRNQSADDCLKAMLQLKKELEAISDDFSQAVRKLHLLDRIPEFRIWVSSYDSLQKELMNKVEETRLKMCQLYLQWLQK